MAIDHELGNLMTIKEESSLFAVDNQMKLETDSQVDRENSKDFTVKLENSEGKQHSSDFSSKGDIPVSVGILCTSRKLFVCYYCEFTSDWRKLFVNHVLDHICSYACEFCNYKTSNFAYLEKHKENHAGEKFYSCTVCSYKSKRSGTFNRHMRIFHNGEKPFRCTVCSYKGNRSRSLKRHMRAHFEEKPFSCTVCSYKCLKSTYLKQHMIIHTDEKPFSCTVCSYKSNRSETLKRHMRTHSKEKPFGCTVCSYKCKQSNNLKRHMRTHSNEKP